MSKQKYFLNELSCFITNHILPPLPINGVSVDSRLVKKGDLFFALPGAQVDGHQFLSEAAAKGCEAAIVSKGYEGIDHGMVLIRVEDPLTALQEMARQVLALRRPKIIAVTGSVGKTTTKEFIAGLLKNNYRVSVSPGNSNSQIGLPLSILNHTTGNEEILILEMGMTHAGHVSRLIEIAPPDIALITMVALVHAGNFEGLSDIGRAKAEIFAHRKTSIGILHRQIENYDELCGVGACQKLSFAVECSNADYSLANEKQKGLLIQEPDESFRINQLKIPGIHNLHNFLGAVVVARCLKMRWDEINLAAMALALPEMRFEIVEKQGAVFVNDSYNASEISAKAALDSLPEPKPGGKRIAVIGEMLELGKFSDQCHAAVGKFALDRVDRMLCLGENCKAIQNVWNAAGRPVELFMDRADIVHALKKELQTGDVVLLKGSRAKALWKVLDEF
jgi:UDP-N-acetylmuramoyl-tripeptide--D-alanyl-D-alanine ligase